MIIFKGILYLYLKALQDNNEERNRILLYNLQFNLLKQLLSVEVCDSIILYLLYSNKLTYLNVRNHFEFYNMPCHEGRDWVKTP